MLQRFVDPSSEGWRRDFLLVWSGSAVSLLGSRAAGFAYPLLALALTGSPVAAGWVGFAARLPNLLFYLPAGVMVDRHDRVRLMLISQSVRGIAVMVLVISLSTGARSLPLLIAVAFVEGSMAVLYTVTETTAIGRIVPPEHLSGAMSKAEGRDHAGAVLGLPVGGLLFGIGRVWPFAFNALTYLFSVVTITLIRNPVGISAHSHDHAGLKQTMGGIGEGAKLIWHSAFLRTTTIVAAGTNVLFQMTILLIIVRGQEQGSPEASTGLILAATGAGGVLGSVVVPRLMRSRSMSSMIVLGTWLWTAAMTSMTVSSHPYVLAVSWASVGLVGSLMNIAISTYQVRTVPGLLLGRVIGASRSVYFGVIPLGSMTGGYVIARAGVDLTALSVAVVMAMFAVLATLYGKRMRAEELGPPRPSAPVR
ncbi:MFS transporter [Streptosporangium sp. CA-135522]|uniref:MFS transporter n=1 Tax=Streptosporangium sp. CA-135522 TaxID=3240072 RepID=UPI003D8D2005